VDYSVQYKFDMFITKLSLAQVRASDSCHLEITSLSLLKNLARSGWRDLSLAIARSRYRLQD
jgi:hypothetical protein